MPLYVFVLAVILAFGSGFGSGWKTRAWKADSDTAAAQEQQAKDAAKRFEHAQESAQKYEAVRVAQHEKAVFITREVEREVKADVDCSNRELPPGLRSALERSAADTDLPQPAGAVPEAHTSPAGDVGRPG